MSRARVAQQWRYQGRWRLAVYYYVGIGMQRYRVFDADQCRPVGSSAEFRDDDRRGAATRQEQADGHDEAPG